MYRDSWPEIYLGPWTVTGNVAKVKVLHQLHRVIANGSSVAILDIGCIGLQPLEFWEPLLANDSFQFHLTGIDVRDVKQAERIVDDRGWKDRVALKQGDAYNLHKVFPRSAFDLIVATQVLEHIGHLPRFAQEVAAVLKPGGTCFFTLDSAHWRSRFDRREPVRLAKNLIKKTLSVLGKEHHYDLPWFDHEVVREFDKVGLEMVDCRYYNLPMLKFIHNHIVSRERQNALMQLWFDLEEFLNEEKTIREKIKHLFVAIYLQFRKPPIL